MGATRNSVVEHAVERNSWGRTKFNCFTGTEVQILTLTAKSKVAVVQQLLASFLSVLTSCMALINLLCNIALIEPNRL